MRKQIINFRILSYISVKVNQAVQFRKMSIDGTKS